MLMNKRLLAGISALAVVCGCLLTSCKKAPQKYSEHSFVYFDTVTTITGYADSQDAFDRVAGGILEELEEYHRLYNVYLRYDGVNNLCTVNDLVDGVHPTVTVDQKIIDLLLYAKDVHRQTDGMTNVAMGSVLKLWHDYRSIGMDNPADATLPPMDKLQEAARHTDIDKVVIDAQNSTVHLSDPAMRLDVGAVAKGYAVERIARRLEQEGVSGYVLNVGGNVRAVGAKPDGTGWTVGVENPDPDADEYLAYLTLDTQSLVTSGSYQRYYIVDGQRYHHIIHPDTLMPSAGLTSVSVVCTDSGQGDALSTALFCMTVEEGKALIDTIPDAEAMWMAEDGTITTTDGWSNYVKQ